MRYSIKYQSSLLLSLRALITDLTQYTSTSLVQASHSPRTGSGAFLLLPLLHLNFVFTFFGTCISYCCSGISDISVRLDSRCLLCLPSLFSLSPFSLRLLRFCEFDFGVQLIGHLLYVKQCIDAAK